MSERVMKTTVIIIFLLLALVVIWFFVQGYLSRSGSAPGLDAGHLASCPDKPNCVCSEYAGDNNAFVAPVELSNISRVVVWPQLKQAIVAMGGTIQQEQDDYLAATFKSSVFGFVDDLEVRFDKAENLLHLRSASRVGHSDFGVNRQRVAALKAALAKQLPISEQLGTH